MNSSSGLLPGALFSSLLTICIYGLLLPGPGAAPSVLKAGIAKEDITPSQPAYPKVGIMDF